MKKKPSSFQVQNIIEKMKQKAEEQNLGDTSLGNNSLNKQGSNKKNLAKSGSTYYVCRECNYVHEGNEPPEKCPICGVGPDEFTERSLGRELV